MDKTLLFTFKINEMRQVNIEVKRIEKSHFSNRESLVLFFVCNLINVPWFKVELDSFCNVAEKSIKFEG